MATSGDEQRAIEGHCLCKAVQITLDQPKKHVEICQCAMCRRWGGAFYSALSGESFSIAGEDSVSVYRSSSWAERAFCKHCGSNLWCKFPPTSNSSFLAGLFVDVDQYPIEREIFGDEAAVWCELAGDHPPLIGAETIAEAKDAGFDLG